MSDSKQVIEVIDAFCEKVGIVCQSANEFLPKLAQHNIVSGLYCMAVWLIFIVAGVLVIMHGRKIEDEDDGDIELSFIVCLVGGFIVALFSIFFLVELHNVIMWAMFPDVEGITYIMGLIGG